MNQGIIFLPGIMGTQLYKGRDLIWPGAVSSLMLPYKLMDQLLDPDLEVGDIIRSFSISEQYSALVAKLGQAGFSEKAGLLRVFPYDWRKSNVDAAEVLAKVIESQFANWGKDVQITLVAHSMGGLIARYYLESGEFGQRAGFGAVRNLFTLGTPHRGAPLALTAAVGLEKRLFLNKEQVQKLVERPEFPSLYQLMPPPGDDFAWDDRARDDLYRPFAPYEHGAEIALVQDNLKSALRFHASLTGKAPEGVRYFCFAGTHMPTLTHVRIGRNGQSLQVLRVESDSAGDGTVPSWSGTLPGVQRQFVGGEHGTIYKTRELLTTLGGLLGVKNTLAADVPVVQVAIRDKVVEPNATAHLSISFPSSVTDLSGEVVVEKMVEREGVPPAFIDFKTYQVNYRGMGAEKIGVTFQAPPDAALYRVRFVGGAANAKPSNPDDFFVQDTLG